MVKIYNYYIIFSLCIKVALNLYAVSHFSKMSFYKISTTGSQSMESQLEKILGFGGEANCFKNVGAKMIHTIYK